jgi:hypothetical protein
MATTTKRKTPRERNNPEVQPRGRTSTASAHSEEEEDRRDIEDALESIEDGKRNGYIPWERIKRNLGF